MFPNKKYGLIYADLHGILNQGQRKVRVEILINTIIVWS